MDHLLVDYLPLDHLSLVHCHTRPCLNQCQTFHLYALTKTRLVDDNPNEAQHACRTVSGINPCNVYYFYICQLIVIIIVSKTTHRLNAMTLKNTRKDPLNM